LTLSTFELNGYIFPSNLTPKIHIESFRLIYLTTDSVDIEHVWDSFYRFSIVVTRSNPILGVAVKSIFCVYVALRGYEPCEGSIAHPTSFTKYPIDDSETHKTKNHKQLCTVHSIAFWISGL
jgi:hypothetical protein